MRLSISTNEPDITYEISGAMWQVGHESKIKLFSSKLSKKDLLEISSFEHE